jgi:hypothetical protein
LLKISRIHWAYFDSSFFKHTAREVIRIFALDHEPADAGVYEQFRAKNTWEMSAVERGIPDADPEGRRLHNGILLRMDSPA